MRRKDGAALLAVGEVAEGAHGVARDDLAGAHLAAHAGGDDEDEQLRGAIERHGHEEVVGRLAKPLQAQHHAPERAPVVGLVDDVVCPTVVTRVSSRSVVHVYAPLAVQQAPLQDERDGLDCADGDEVQPVGLDAREVAEGRGGALGELFVGLLIPVGAGRGK